MQTMLGVPLRIRRTVFLVGLCLALTGALGTAHFAFAASDPSVTIVDFDFQPTVLSVNPGETVMWTNTGNVIHTTTSDKPQWDSSSLAAGATFSFRFTAPGTFSYHCAIHPGMRGLIFVPSTPGEQPTANDGRQLSNQSPSTQMLFSATWGDRAAMEWVTEHDAALAGHPIGNGSQPSSGGVSSTPAPAAPAAPASPAPPPAAPAPAVPAPAAPAAPPPAYP